MVFFDNLWPQILFCYFHRLTTLTHDAIRYALNYLDVNGLVDFSDFDGDGDGFVDSITFLHTQ
jgi:hypothetical protein